jgi:chemotaxis-related protein WspB
MLALLFYLGKDAFAVDSSKVLEVIPCINLKTLAHAPEHVAGVFDYRGIIVPVIDLSQLLHHSTSKKSLSTRIILFRNPELGQEKAGESIIGLMAERVTETRKMSEKDFLPTGVRVDSIPYLAEISSSQNDMIQYIRVEHLLSLAINRNLPAGAAASNARLLPQGE